MNEKFEILKKKITGNWLGEGFAKFPTITDTAYSEYLHITADQDKQALYYNQKTSYKGGEKDGQTVFWDAGFIAVVKDDILLVSAQIGGRTETLKLVSFDDRAVFESVHIENDEKTIRSQRIFMLEENRISYELNMNTHQAPDFQNHLKAELQCIDKNDD